MTSLDELTKKRSFAKTNFILNHRKILSLINLFGTEACESIQDAKDLMLKIENCYSVFLKAHDSYIEALEDSTVEKDIKIVLDTQFKFFNDVEANFISVRKLYNRFLNSTLQEVAARNAAKEQKKKH